jgi:hypothetical protein
LLSEKTQISTELIQSLKSFNLNLLNEKFLTQ